MLQEPLRRATPIRAQHRRNLYLVRRIKNGFVEPLFSNAYCLLLLFRAAQQTLQRSFLLER